MDLYFSPRCGNSRRVLFTLAELGIEANERALDLGNREHRTAAYLSLNPSGKVPALIDGAIVLWESNAIALYLAERFPDKRLVPTAIEERAELHKWLFYLPYEIAPPAWRYFFNVRGYKTLGGTANADDLRNAEQQLVTALGPLEDRLDGRSYLLGEFSLADIAYAPSFANLVAAGFDLARWPSIDAWVQRVLDRPAWRKVASRSG